MRELLWFRWRIPEHISKLVEEVDKGDSGETTKQLVEALAKELAKALADRTLTLFTLQAQWSPLGWARLARFCVPVVLSCLSSWFPRQDKDSGC